MVQSLGVKGLGSFEFRGLGFGSLGVMGFPDAPCTFIVDTYALKGSLYRYFKA